MVDAANGGEEYLKMANRDSANSSSGVSSGASSSSSSGGNNGAYVSLAQAKEDMSGGDQAKTSTAYVDVATIQAQQQQQKPEPQQGYVSVSLNANGKAAIVAT